jgi:hypothetical protein
MVVPIDGRLVLALDVTASASHFGHNRVRSACISVLALVCFLGSCTVNTVVLFAFMIITVDAASANHLTSSSDANRWPINFFGQERRCVSDTILLLYALFLSRFDLYYDAWSRRLADMLTCFSF